MWMMSFVLAACGSTPDLVGTWHRVASEETIFDYEGTPIAWCATIDEALVLDVDGTYEDVRVRTPDDSPDACDGDSAGEEVTTTEQGIWTLVRYDAGGSYVLVFERTRLVVQGEDDDTEDLFKLAVSYTIAWSEDNDGRNLWIDGIGMFESAAE